MGQRTLKVVHSNTLKLYKQRKCNLQDKGVMNTSAQNLKLKNRKPLEANPGRYLCLSNEVGSR